MDEVLESLTVFVAGVEPGTLSDSAIHMVKRRLIDSIACMFGGFDGDPSVIARGVARRTSGSPSATVLGNTEQSTLDVTAFANTVMLRYLDFNDTNMTPSGAGGHFSELIPALLATAEAQHAHGNDLLTSVALGYEVSAALANRMPAARGWDYAIWIGVASAMTSGKLLGLKPNQIAHAGAIAAISNISTWASRAGQLSMWKACASASANRNGVYAALLAADGMTGPEAPFAGKDGIMDLVTGERFTLDLPVPYDRPWAVEETSCKISPCQYDAQGPVELMLRLRDQLGVDDLTAIRVDSFWRSYREDGARQPAAKWDPKTRETADHSLPYLLAVALVDGEITLDSFAEKRFSDPALRPIMDKITIYKNPEFVARFPKELNSRLTINMTNGTVEDEITFPYGHFRNPPSDDELNEKWDSMARYSRLDQAVCRELRDGCWNLESVNDVAPLLALLARVRPK